MHRSGTSWLARALNLGGADIGQESEWSGPDNIHGFWEDRAALAINEGMLAKWEASWSSPPTSDYKPLAIPLKVLQSWVESYSGDPVVVKDPRFTFTYPSWEMNLLNTTLVAPIRHPMAVAYSLRERNDIPTDEGLELWKQYNEKAFELGARFVEFPSQKGFKKLCRDLGLRPCANNFRGDAVHQKAEAAPGLYQRLFDTICLDIPE